MVFHTASTGEGEKGATTSAVGLQLDRVLRKKKPKKKTEEACWGI